jgi:hypothetical protein
MDELKTPNGCLSFLEYNVGAYRLPFARSKTSLRNSPHLSEGDW